MDVKATDAALRVTGLCKSFGHVQAVKGIDFQVSYGECFGLLGSNGAGKSTVIKMLTTLLPIDEGGVQICGYSLPQEAVAVRQLIGYVPQALSVDGALTGYENLLIFSKLYGLTRSARERRIREILEMLELDESAHRPVKTYSGGMIRRLEIGQAILHQPKVLFLDEPTVGLDPIARKGIWNHVELLRREQKMTVILTTHYMEEAEELCERIAMMSRGQLAALGTIDELRAKMGNPQANMDQLFAYFAGSPTQEQGELQDVRQTRFRTKHFG